MSNSIKKTHENMKAKNSKEATEVVVILDCSYSMGHIYEKTLSSLNEFIQSQKDIDGDANFTLVFFSSSSEYSKFYDRADLSKISLLTEEDYQLLGMTALNDAIGRTLSDLNHTLNNIEEENRPGKVVVTIITDGDENNSVEYQGSKGAKKIKDLITEKQESGWIVSFLGANIDSQLVATNYGIDKDFVDNYSHSSKGISIANTKMGNLASSVRGSSSKDLKEMKLNALSSFKRVSENSEEEK